MASKIADQTSKYIRQKGCHTVFHTNVISYLFLLSFFSSSSSPLSLSLVLSLSCLCGMSECLPIFGAAVPCNDLTFAYFYIQNMCQRETWWAFPNFSGFSHVKLILDSCWSWLCHQEDTDAIQKEFWSLDPWQWMTKEMHSLWIMFTLVSSKYITMLDFISLTYTNRESIATRIKQDQVDLENIKEITFHSHTILFRSIFEKPHYLCNYENGISSKSLGIRLLKKMK